MADDNPTLSVIAISGEYERVHYALAMVAGALAVGRKANLFLTHGAIRALTRDAGGREGWKALPADAQAHDDQPTAGGIGDLDAGAVRDAALRERGVGDFETLLSACVELGARIIVCEMGLRAQGIDAGSIRRDVPHEIAGIVTLLAATPAGAHLVTV